MIQAILFDKTIWTPQEASKFLKIHNYKLLKDNKMRETAKYYRYRITQPDYKKYLYRILSIGDKNLGVKFIYGFPK